MSFAPVSISSAPVGTSLSPRNWRIGTRLVLGFGLLIVMMLIMVSVSVARIGGLVETNRHIIEHEWVNADAANTLSSIAQANARRTIEIYFAASDAQRAQKRADILAGREAFIKAFKILQQQIEHPEGKQWLSEAEQARGRYVKSQAKFNELVDAGRKDEAFAELQQHTLVALMTVQDRVDRLAKQQQQQVVQSGAQAKAEAEFDRTLMMMLGAIGLIVGLVLATVITRSIIGPMRQAVAVAQAVAAGDLSSEVQIHSRDEAGQLLQALHDMNDSLAAIVHDVRQSSDTIATASSQIAAGNIDLSSRTEQQAAALEQTTASMHELADTVQQNCHSGDHANQLAKSASQVALRGGEVVGQVVHTMEAINISSRKIADIITVIDGIAFQTNILALNAAVEAARAGELGRGFAVVAGEVRSLAGRSAEAAKEIKELIETSVRDVSNGCVLVEKAGSTMEEIVASVRRVSEIMGEMSVARADQTQGIGQINEAMGQMDHVTQSNAALVEQSAAAAQSLERQAQMLAQTVSVFHLGGRQPPPYNPHNALNAS